MLAVAEAAMPLPSQLISRRIRSPQPVPNYETALFKLSVKKCSSNWLVERGLQRKSEQNSDPVWEPRGRTLLEGAASYRIAAPVFLKTRADTGGRVETSSSASRHFNFSLAASQFQTRPISRPLE